MIPFAVAVAGELRNARAAHKAINSLHEGYAVILEELEEFKAEVFKRSYARSFGRALAELVQVGAIAQRIAEDVLGVPHELPSPTAGAAMTSPPANESTSSRVNP